MNTANSTPGPLKTQYTGPSTPDIRYFLDQSQFRTYDALLATGFFICLVIGLPGNCLALAYFAQTKNRNLPTLLYMAASSTDIVTSIVHLPVTLNLLNMRDPGLLGSEIFCRVWYYTLLSLQLMSMFVVMLLSLSRTIVILFPFYRINKKVVLMSIPAALLYYSVWNVWLAVDGEYYYEYGAGYCGLRFDYESIGGFDVSGAMTMINYCVSTGIPPIIVFAAMVTAIARLRSQKVSHESQRKSQQASLTIILFATVFLACNLLTFINVALYTSFQFMPDKGYLDFYKNQFMFFYSWLISEIFCTVLNSSLNPILYVCRIRELRVWGRRVFRREHASREKGTRRVDQSEDLKRGFSGI